jgi:glucan-binding YG repeat protein
MTVAHIWRAKPEDFAKPATQPDKKTIEDPTYINGGKSLEPTCLLPGFELYLCEYDAKGIAHGHTAVDQYKKVPIDPLKHDWTDWVKIETFESEEGKVVTRYARSCKRCKAVENKNEVNDKPAAKNGLIKNDKGQWEYYKDDVFQKDFVGIVEFEGGHFFVGGGIVPAYDGLALYNNTWYMLSQGQIQSQYNGLALYDGEWFFLTDGILDTSRAGLVSYDGAQFAIAAGRKLTELNGLWMNTDGKWYYMSQGQVQDYSGVAQYDGRFFVLKNGMLDTSYNGTIEYDGKTFEVVDGQLSVSPI